jgi:RNA methyltransferase, TrmH family
MSVLRSKDNARVRRWHALGHDGRARRTQHCALLEGPHLLAAYLDAGARPLSVIVSESGLRNPEIAALVQRAGPTPVTLTDGLFRWIADAATPAGLAAEIALVPAAASLAEARHALFLDGLQDAGNVGTLLRSAAAFGADTAVLGTGCADPWSPKVLRAAMGGHFALRIVEVPSLVGAMAEFRGTLVCAVPAGGEAPAAVDLTGRLGWIFGAEGQGVSPAAASRASYRISIPLAPGAESLNVAAAAAILFYERARQLSTSGARF